MLKNLLFIFILFTSSYSQQNISWYFNYDKALSKAQKENKRLFVLLVDGKKDSKMLLQHLYKNKKLTKTLNEQYINILINVNYKISYPIELYYTTKFPTIFIVNSKLELIINKPVYNIKDIVLD